MKVETALKRIKQHCVYHKCQGCCFKKTCDTLNFNVLQLTNDMLRIKAKQKREEHINNGQKEKKNEQSNFNRQTNQRPRTQDNT